MTPRRFSRNLRAVAALGLILSPYGFGKEPRLKDLNGVWRAWFNNDASVVLVQMSHGGAGLWDVESGEMIPSECNQAQPSEQGRVVVMRDDRRTFAVKMNDRAARVFDFASGKPLSPLLKAVFSERDPPRAMFSPDGTTFLAMDAADHTKVFSLPGGELRATLIPPSPAPKKPSDNCVQAIFTADASPAS